MKIQRYNFKAAVCGSEGCDAPGSLMFFPACFGGGSSSSSSAANPKTNTNSGAGGLATGDNSAAGGQNSINLASLASYLESGSTQVSGNKVSGGVGNTSTKLGNNSGNTSTAYDLSNVGNTSNSTSNSTSVSNSGNTSNSTSNSTSVSNSGNTSNSTSNSTSVSNSGNTTNNRSDSTVTSFLSGGSNQVSGNTGTVNITDQGAVQSATDLAGRVVDAQSNTFQNALDALGQIAGNATQQTDTLAAQNSANLSAILDSANKAQSENTSSLNSLVGNVLGSLQSDMATVQSGSAAQLQKTLLYLGLGGLAVLGIGFFFLRKK